MPELLSPKIIDWFNTEDLFGYGVFKNGLTKGMEHISRHGNEGFWTGDIIEKNTPVTAQKRTCAILCEK